jgi:hypothetical protein
MPSPWPVASGCSLFLLSIVLCLPWYRDAHSLLSIGHARTSPSSPIHVAATALDNGDASLFPPRFNHQVEHHRDELLVVLVTGVLSLPARLGWHVAHRTVVSAMAGIKLTLEP